MIQSKEEASSHRSQRVGVRWRRRPSWNMKPRVEDEDSLCSTALHCKLLYTSACVCVVVRPPGGRRRPHPMATVASLSDAELADAEPERLRLHVNEGELWPTISPPPHNGDRRGDQPCPVP
uniref:Uncharacterized protein n=1 Tax=Zea mays TaxID=4577 RepID=A0A804M143_MAIZE